MHGTATAFLVFSSATIVLEEVVRRRPAATGTPQHPWTFFLMIALGALVALLAWGHVLIPLRRRVWSVRLLALPLLALVTAPSRPAVVAAATIESGADVVARARAIADRIADKSMHLTLRTIAPSGATLSRTLQGYEKRMADGRRIRWDFERPADMSGTSFLALQPTGDGPHALWVYFPAQRRVRQVADQLRHERFQGSDFTYEDQSIVFYFDYRGSHELRSEGPCGERRCWEVETTLAPGAFAYARVVSWVRTDSTLPERVEFHDDRGLLKELTVHRTAVIDGIPTIMAMEVRNVRDGYRTVVEYDSVRYNTQLRDDLFSVQALGHGR